jgi:hypothetical protein
MTFNGAASVAPFFHAEVWRGDDFRQAAGNSDSLQPG